jgi:uncharacterized protein YjiS (DUF1127 family)
MSGQTTTETPAEQHPSFTLVGTAIAAVYDAVTQWQQRANDRATLATFNDRMLSDIGLDRMDAWRESHKPFWRA